MQHRDSVSSNNGDNYTNHSKQSESAVTPSKIATLSTSQFE